MSSLTLSRRNLLPTWTSDLLDTGRFFGPRMLDFDGDFPSWDLANRIPSVNIKETDKEFLLEMAVPGYDKKDFKLEVDNGMLTISSEKEQEKKEDKKNYTRREYSFNSFSRSFALPENCQQEKILAKYDNGILNVSIPKKDVTVSKPAKEIKVS